MDQQQPMPSWVVVVIVALLIFGFLGAALFIINPGVIRGLFSNPAANPTAALATNPPAATAVPTLPPTQASTETPAASPTVIVAPSATLANTDTPDSPTLATNAPAATATPAPMQTTAPTLAPTVAKSPTPTAVPLNPDRAEFVTDVTAPDGTVFAPGAAFTKTWRIKNVGTTTWSTQYTLEFTVGAQMPVVQKVAFPKEVAPGDTMDISMDMIAPATVGDHTALFQFRNASGQPFGVGPRYNEAIYIKITVSEVTPTP